MNKLQIEAWALRLIDAAKATQPNEDSFAELKSEWPSEVREIKRAARQIAAHANASHGEPILWLIGVDEEKGVVGADKNELANWFPKIQAEFDGVAPELKFVLNVPADGKMVVALNFETDRAPFVVKNSEGGSHIAYEVPWREGNKTRTAKRADLVRLLSPLQKLPAVEFLSAALIARPNSRADYSSDQAVEWDLTVHLYVIPSGRELLTLPFHHCKAFVDIPEHDLAQAFEDVKMRPEIFFGRGVESRTVDGTSTEVLITGPGKVIFSATGYSRRVELTDVSEMTGRVDLTPAASDLSVETSFTISRKDWLKGDMLARWAKNYKSDLDLEDE